MDDNMADANERPNVDPAIFQYLQDKIDEEGKVRDELKEIVQQLEREGRVTQSILSRIHNTPTSSLDKHVISPASEALRPAYSTVAKLAAVASKHPFYKWNSIWQREMQTLISNMQLTNWLSSLTLVTIEEIGAQLDVPVNLKDRDAFHITIEDYLLALTNTIDELARLAPNAVTHGDLARPLQISRFVNDVHAGFQLLNLKNDLLRRRVDGLKYSVKKVEDVVYDLSLRGLLPKASSEETSGPQSGVGQD